jgi:four helix bundle protein
MLPKTGLRVLDAARCVVDEIETAMKRARRPWPGAAQLRDAAASIVANIGEGFGRADGPDRVHFLRIARGSAEEANERLRILYAAHRIETRDYWRIHHRLVAIVRMLTSLMARISERARDGDSTDGAALSPRPKPAPSPPP